MKDMIRIHRGPSLFSKRKPGTVPLLFAACVFLLASPGYSGYGTTGAQILNLRGSARSEAMANSFSATRGDIDAIGLNPAGLCGIVNNQLRFTKLMYFMGTSMNEVALALKSGKLSMGFLYKSFVTEDTAISNIGYEAKKFKISYLQYSGVLSMSLSNKLDFGLGFNLAKESFGLKEVSSYGKDLSASALSYDFGMIYRYSSTDSYGLILRGAGSSIKLYESEDPLPREIVIAGAHKMGRFLMLWEAFTGKRSVFAYKTAMQFAFGAIQARCGLINIVKPEISIGFGIPFKSLGFDYAFTPHQDLGVAHRLSLTSKF